MGIVFLINTLQVVGENKTLAQVFPYGTAHSEIMNR